MANIKTTEQRLAALEIHMGQRVADLEKRLEETTKELKRVREMATPYTGR